MEVCVSKPYSEFGLDFSSKQQIHLVRQKLFHAESIISNTQDTMKMIKTHEKHVALICNLTSSVHNSFQHELENVMGELRNYSHTVRKLLATSLDIRSMVSSFSKEACQTGCSK
jgi:hypothetical protein